MLGLETPVGNPSSETPRTETAPAPLGKLQVGACLSCFVTGLIGLQTHLPACPEARKQTLDLQPHRLL